ncbi:6,7-dimethyl-8-ribityllumazine synthase [Candidatus Kaiserbacteria bacterium]|nr:6,7-dimethyl-8-ribityllumazine synthase [Candidatus Kaiserbacteria bacterium]
MQRKHYALPVRAKDASKLRVGIVISRFNADITDNLLCGARETLEQWGVKKANVHVFHVPGSFELPLGALKLIRKKKLDCIVALGCVIKGETKHDEYIASAVSHGFIRLMLDHAIPIGFGVITPNSLAQAKVRSRGKTNKGSEATIAALEMALL